MMTQSEDHDILIEMRQDLKYIKADLKKACKERAYLMKENQDRKDWQQDWDAKIKTVGGIAGIVGGILGFAATQVLNWVKKEI